MIALIIKSVSECNGAYTLRFYPNELKESIVVERSDLKGRRKPKKGDVVEATIENKEFVFFLNGEMIKGK